MLLQFKVKNFRSYAEAAELSLLRGTKQRASSDDARIVRCTPNGPDVLRAAAIFGPNAGGKSNLLKAILSLKRSVLRSAANADTLSNESFASPHFAAKPVHFEIEFVAGDQEFHYSVDFVAGSVVLESLYSKAIGSRLSASLLFRRTNQGTDRAAEIEFSGELKDHEDIDQWRRNTRPHQLFLSQSQNLSAAPILSNPFAWFSLKLCSMDTVAVVDEYESYTRRRMGDSEFNRRMVNELIAADLGVTEVKVRRTELPYVQEVVDGKPVMRSMTAPSGLEFVHTPSVGPTFNLDFKNESDGTKFFFSLLGHLDDAIQNDRILLIDELDRSLHPLLVRRIVRAFSQGKSKSQLVFTTHDATLLDADVLRRDQVWFAERDAQHQSTLRRLAAGNVRLDKALMRAYLDGQFQGVPITDSQGAFGDE